MRNCWCHFEFNIIFLLLMLLLLKCHGFEEFYCNKALCKYQGDHIGCRNDKKFSSNCVAGTEEMFLDDDNVDLILHLHNYYRDQIAIGNVTNYKTATRMATVEWNNELADLALLNLKTCTFEHDACHNTAEFWFSGQNLGGLANTQIFRPLDVFITAMIEGWFNEHKIADMSTIRECCTAYDEGPTTHFTQIVLDRVTHVGCAVIRYTKMTWKTMLIACNYASANVVGYRIYATGKTASKCITGNNPLYPGLCSIWEPINPNILPSKSSRS